VWDNSYSFLRLGEMLNRSKIIGVIPARFDSQRLPGKVLRRIGDRAMLDWVYDRARRSPLLTELVVATDSEEVLRYCSDWSIPAFRTRRHNSGSDRLHEVMEGTDGDIYINIQGDEPTIRPDHIELLLRPILAGKGDVTTLKVAMDPAAARDPNCVKVVTDNSGQALYFSRAPIPFNRDGLENVRYYKHIGLYAYTRAALERFHSIPQSTLEKAEKLEQLRLLENGIPIIVEETTHDTVGVDTEEDLRRATAFLIAERKDT
jgi:3-deoxy-manno-octulosonate cytidylyltransferase (CMP-KDO synthetase)